MYRDRIADPRDTTSREAQHVDSRASAEQLERADVRGIGVELVTCRVADDDRDRAYRWRREARRSPQPIARPMRRECPRCGLDPEAAVDLLERRQQPLLDRAIDRSQRERSLDRLVGALALVGDQRPDERVRVGRQALSRAGNRRRDRQSLLQRVTQRGDLAVSEKAVLAGRALRLREAESALPSA